MIKATFIALAGLILVALNDHNKIDESLLRGTWVAGDFKCGSDMEFIYRDGMIGNPIPKTHEMYKYGDFYPIYQVVSATRKGGQAWIAVRSTLADRHEDPVYTMIYRIEKNRYVFIRSFTDQRVEKFPDPRQNHDWVRCDN
jgi:hypothetical protein